MITTVKEDFYDDSFVLSKKDGLSFSVGFSPYDTSTEP